MEIEVNSMLNKANEMSDQVLDLTSEVEDGRKIVEERLDEISSKMNETGIEDGMQETHEEFFKRMEEHFEECSVKFGGLMKRTATMHRLVDLDVHTFMSKMEGGIFNRDFEKDKDSKETGIYEKTTTDEEIDSVESHAATKEMIEHEMGRIVGDFDGDEFEVDSKYHNDELNGGSAAFESVGDSTPRGGVK